ncbi:NlpC/P60 family protein [Actinokineospora sp. NBRC 105648]|uniref:NlpC/P60 family protein n=1 Tax=Actinokineospora sp. NBRC 105648 TaxID=3032206 RepID=UPI0025558F6E|nr:NlpC/P60 family protein [Actinokineospora sp. NBRC 105648]
MGTRTIAVTVAAILVAAALVGGGIWYFTRAEGRDTTETADTARAEDPDQTATISYQRLTGPDRTMARDGRGAVLAVFTDGARTVLVNGPNRTFREPKATTAAINTQAWIRLAPEPWHQGDERAIWFAPWFDQARADRTPDVLAIATDYLIDAPAEEDAKGVRFRGDASFGPVKSSGVGRKEQSDFYDYLGVPWTFPGAPTTQPAPDRYGAVDCSGFIRLVYGYRMGIPLLGTNEPGPGLPRRAYAIAESGPGVELVPNKRKRATAYGTLQPGDLVFFEIEDGPDQLDHAGIYLGLDDAGHHRFISSRERIDGPTFGDVGGTSLLDDGGHYSTAWRAARRL